MAMMIELRMFATVALAAMSVPRQGREREGEVAHLLRRHSPSARAGPYGLAADATLSTATINDRGSSCTGSTVIHTTIKKAAAAAILNLSTSAEAANASVAPIVRSARLTTISPAP